MLICTYHAKTDATGWHPIKSGPIDSGIWDDHDTWAIRHMMANGHAELIMGFSLWTLSEAARHAA